MTTTIRPRSTLDRIGGPNALSWPVVITGYVFTWLVFLFDLPSPGMPEQGVRMVYLTIAQLLMIVVLRGARMTVLRDTASRSRPWATMATYALASVVVTATLGYLIKDRPVALPAHNTFGYASNAAATFVVLVIAAIAADAFAQHRRQQDVLSEDRMRLEHVRAVVSKAIAERQEVTVTRISEQLTEAVSQLEEDSPQEAVDTLRWAAQDLVRPLSHDLATKSVPFTADFPTDPPRGLNWPSVLKDATTGAPIRAIPLALISTALTVVYRIDKFGMTLGLVASAADALAVWLGAVIANRILAATGERLPLLARATALTVVLGVLGAIGVGVQRFFLPVHGTVGTLLLNIVITIFIGWALALLRATRNQLDHTDAEIAKLRHELEWAIARANQTQWQQQRALARALARPSPERGQRRRPAHRRGGAQRNSHHSPGGHGAHQHPRRPRLPADRGRRPDPRPGTRLPTHPGDVGGPVRHRHHDAGPSSGERRSRPRLLERRHRHRDGVLRQRHPSRARHPHHGLHHPARERAPRHA